MPSQGVNSMFIAYYDESGDDGFPKYSSPLFVLSALYVHYSDWKNIFENVRRFRVQLQKDFGLPVKWEFHTRGFILNKNPYRDLSLSDEIRMLVVELFCNLLARLDLKFVNVAINKKKIQTSNYNVLDKSLTYSIQRIENDLYRIDPAKKFMIITDEGRIGKMIKTARKIQRINFIPSKYEDVPYRQDIKALIEDPLQKDSKESYFIQMADLVSYIVYLLKIKELNLGEYPNRMPSNVDIKRVKHWMDELKSSLNLEASESDPYGIVCYPK